MDWAEDRADHSALWPIVQALLRIPSLTDASGRNLVVRMVCDELDERLPVEEHKNAIGHLYSIVEVCGRRPDGLATLQVVIDRIEQDSKPARALREIIDQSTALSMFPAGERKKLFSLLAGVVVPNIADYYHVAAGPAAPRLREQTTYLEVFRALETLNAGPNGLPKPLVFIEHVATIVRPELGIELRRWVDRQAEQLHLMPELKALRNDLLHSSKTSSPPPHAEAYLVFQLQREGATGDQYRLYHWRQLDLSTGWYPIRGGDEVGSLASMKRSVATLIEQVESDWAQHVPTINIEFILPGEILNLDVDQWSWEVESLIPMPLGCRYPTVVRSLDRMVTRKWLRSWNQRWIQLTEQLNGAGVLDRSGICQGHAGTPEGIRELASTFEQRPNLVALVLSAPPVPETRGQDEVAVGLRAGVPVILWHRENCASEEFLATAHSVFHNDDDKDTMLERVRRTRVTAFREGPRSGHVGNQLTILWDDPKRTVTLTNAAPPEEAAP
ncbi:hypothetical protein ACFFQW_24745 [Umezawaea endophytica]|uniref:Uncharacterized protein n=2 Tax=Umezawaea endophytica TaxID=1654476 RepID=A0A9X2VGM1_9PSEU|nr:hypothetical protein [Umezawaea endophytica]